jgi:hypothetical protein
MENKEVELYDMSTRIKELEFIQNIITRLSDRQQMTKYICWTFIVAVFGMTQFSLINNQAKLIALVSSLVLVWSFYKLDLNFLKTEKLYRLWYDFICWKRSETCQWLFELNPKNIKQILKEESAVFCEFNPSVIESESKRSWALPIYKWTAIFVFLSYIMPYLPACLAALSIHFSILSEMHS